MQFQCAQSGFSTTENCFLFDPGAQTKIRISLLEQLFERKCLKLIKALEVPVLINLFYLATIANAIVS